jgi:hypothetical protein
LRKKNVCFHGAITAFFIIAAITTFIVGIIGFANLKEKKKMNFNIFTYTLPFVAFILDHSVKKIKNIGEKSIFVLIKLIIIIYYLGAYVLALQSMSSVKYIVIAHINFLIYPFVSAIYNYFLRKKRF